MRLYHGSIHVIEHPVFGAGKATNDYGLGFYCTEHIELAKEWACGEPHDGFANAYDIDMDGLAVLNLNDERWTILNWLALLVNNRRIQVTTPIQDAARQYLLAHFLPDISTYDIVRGYRADDSYFSFARAFLGNEISLAQLSTAMRLGELGEQVAIKSRRTFKRLVFAGAEIADARHYHLRRRTRDESAREAFQREASNPDIDGLFMRDILRAKMEADDARLR